MDNIAVKPQTIQIPNYSGVNIQIFNPTVAAPGSTVPPANINAGNYLTNPVYPNNYYTQNLTQSVPQGQTPVKTEEKKKTEKRQVVQLTDGYVKNLESYLNSQDKQERLAAAKEVIARLDEDKSRKNDPALRALVNKMLQDPSQPVRIMGMVAMENEMVLPNNKSVAVLKQIQQRETNDHQDEMQASHILLKITGVKTEKEVEVTDKDKKSKSKKEVSE
jgi:hypothetical protein